MKPALIIQMTIVLLLVAVTATAQGKHKRSKDNTTALQEFARLGKWNQQWPVLINLHIRHHVTPTVSASDSADTDLTLYYDPHAFYMQAEGMEQIANDSVLVMVNNTARMIKVFPNKGLLFYSQANTITSFMPDTSLEKLSQRFIATIQDDGHAGRRIILQSRDRIAETGFEKEVIDVIYNTGNYQPIQYKQIRRSVVPVDSATYSEMTKDAAWKERLITTKVKAAQLFFVVKEQATECRFTNIDYEKKASPVHEHDRVIKTSAGEYLPAKGYEGYNVSEE
jgi:hypothetical protein